MNVLICISFLFGVISSQNVPTAKLRLNSGHDIPVIGLGTHGINGSTKSEVTKVKQIVLDAVNTGYRLFDTEANYDNQKPIGAALNEAISEGLVRRDQLFISTKIKVKNVKSNTTAYHTTLESILKALGTLELTYLDLTLFSPFDNSEANCGAWKAYETAVSVGWVKSIGVAEFNLSQLQSLIRCAEVFPAINEVESHSLLTKSELIDYTKQYKIRLIARTPFGGGSLAKDPTIATIGQKYKKTAAQVMLRYQYQRGFITVPQTSKINNMIENINIFDFELKEEDMKKLDNM